MAKDSIRKKLASLLPSEPSQEEKIRARRELGIEGLGEGESLMNTATFSRVHIAAVLDQEDSSPAEPVDELLLDEIVTEPSVQGGSPVPIGGRPVDSVELAGLERAMMSAKSRDELAHVALRIATYYAKSAALFVVHRGIVSGLASAGDGEPDGIDTIMIPEQSESVLCRSVQTRRPVRGGPDFGEVDRRVLRAMGRRDVKEILALPVPIGDRVVGVLYADNATETLPDTGAGALRVLALGLAEAYERLVQDRKQGV